MVNSAEPHEKLTSVKRTQVTFQYYCTCYHR
jgi:hypothetical protein